MTAKTSLVQAPLQVAFAVLFLIEGCALGPDVSDSRSGHQPAQDSEAESAAPETESAQQHPGIGSQPDVEFADVHEDALQLEISRPVLGAVDVDVARADTSVHLELRRGAPRATEWQGDPFVEGEFEGDVLVEDSQGRVVLVELGGDRAADPTWQARLAKAPGDIDPALRKRELALAIAAADQAALDPRLDPEEKVLARGLAVSARATLAEFDTGSQALLEAEPSSWHPWDNDPFVDEHDEDLDSCGDEHDERDQPKGNQRAGALASLYVHQVYIRSASCCWSFGTHSATRLRVFNSSATLVYDVKTRNHGRLVDDPSMKTESGCPKSWSGRTNAMPPYQPYLATDLDGTYNMAGGCNSPVTINNGGHTCNDDSWAQYTNVKNNSAGVYARCTDSLVAATAPTCY